MSWIETTLNRLEENIRVLIEGENGSDGVPRKIHRQLERKVRLAMMEGILKQVNEADPDEWMLIAPDQYILMLPPSQAELVLTHPLELDCLAHQLENIAQQQGITFMVPPLVRVVANPQSIEIMVFTDFSHKGLGDSRTSQLEDILGSFSGSPPNRLPMAYLVVNGLTTFSISEPVINIGRDPSNQLCLEDMRVSRLHAQLRFVQDHFVIFDLDSKGGTFVNGVAVTSQVLKPGDVILIAGIPLVYGQELSDQGDYTQELPIDPPTPEVL